MKTKGSSAIQRDDLITKGAKRSLNAAGKKVAALWSRAERDDVQARFAIGEVIRDIVNKPEKYGPNAVERLAEELGKSRSLVYSYGTVAKNWTSAELSALLKRAGGRLTWSHLETVSGSRIDEERREALLETVIKKGLTVAELKSRLPVARGPGLVETDEEDLADARLITVPVMAYSGPVELRVPVTVNQAEAEPIALTVLVTHEDEKLSEVPSPKRPLPDCVTALGRLTGELLALAHERQHADQATLSQVEAIVEQDVSEDVLSVLTLTRAKTEELADLCRAGVDKIDLTIAAFRRAIDAKSARSVVTEPGNPSGVTITEDLKPSVQPA